MNRISDNELYYLQIHYYLNSDKLENTDCRKTQRCTRVGSLCSQR